MRTFEGRFRGAASLIGLLILAAGQPAQATTYSDGGTHTVSGADSNDVVSNGTTVNVVPGATVTGMNMDPGGFNGITVSGSTSALNVSGGSITGGNGSHGGGDARIWPRRQFQYLRRQFCRWFFEWHLLR